MKSLVIIYLLFYAALLVRGEEPENLLEFYGEESLELLSSPDSIEACLLKMNTSRKYILWGRKKRSSKYKEWICRSVREPYKSELKGLLNTDETYRWGLKTFCGPVYGVRIRVNKDHKTIEIDFCFSCGHLLVKDQNGETKYVYFDEEKKDFIHLFEQIFPEVLKMRKKNQNG